MYIVNFCPYAALLPISQVHHWGQDLGEENTESEWDSFISDAKFSEVPKNCKPDAYFIFQRMNKAKKKICEQNVKILNKVRTSHSAMLSHTELERKNQ